MFYNSFKEYERYLIIVFMKKISICVFIYLYLYLDILVMIFFELFVFLLLKNGVVVVDIFFINKNIKL